jgi:putative transposase
LRETVISLLTALSDAERAAALGRFNIIRPYLEQDVPLAVIARQRGIGVETARSWVNKYRRDGLAGLARQRRSDRAQRRISARLQQAIEGFALKRPRLSAAAIYRKILPLAARLGEKAPGYSSVYGVVRRLDPALFTLAHDGPRSYGETFELIHRTEAKQPNAIWQADHTLLDI